MNLKKVRFLQPADGIYGFAQKDEIKVVEKRIAVELEDAGIAKIVGDAGPGAVASDEKIKRAPVFAKMS